MDRIDLDTRVGEWLKDSRGLARNIIRNFYSEDIHRFRLGLKKQRAFLRLLGSGQKKHKPVLPKSIQQFYRNTGVVRDLELHRNSIVQRFEDMQDEVPSQYIHLLNQKILQQQQWMSGFRWHKEFKDEEDKLIKQLPGKLSDNSSRKFINKKLKELSIQLDGVQSDETFHTVRKILKDILYAWPFIDIKQLPSMISGKAKLKKMTALLGDLVDHHVAIDFLSGTGVQELSNKQEKQSLEKMKAQLVKEKDQYHASLSIMFSKLRGQLLKMM